MSNQVVEKIRLPATVFLGGALMNSLLICKTYTFERNSADAHIL